MIYSKRAQGEISNSVLKAVLIWMVFSMSLLFSYMFVSVLTQSVTNSTIAHIMESTSYIWAWWATRFVSRWLIVGPNVINNLDQKYRYQRWVPLLLLGTTICVSVMASIVPVKSISLVVKGTAYPLNCLGGRNGIPGVYIPIFKGLFYASDSKFDSSSDVCISRAYGEHEQLLLQCYSEIPDWSVTRTPCEQNRNVKSVYIYSLGL